MTSKPKPETDTPKLPPQPDGPYYALLIGDSNYQHLSRLQTGVRDADALGLVLREQYGFKTQILREATRSDFVGALMKYRRELPVNSNLLIYFAGHGYYDRDRDEGYWLPIDAKHDNTENWIGADEVRRMLRAIPSKHILIISGTCLFHMHREDIVAPISPAERPKYLERMLASKSRTMMCGDVDEPVTDGATDGHSMFAGIVMGGLRQTTEDLFAAAELFQGYIERGIAERSRHLPQYESIRESGDDLGDFVFLRHRPEGGTVGKPSDTRTIGDRTQDLRPQ